MKPPPKSHAEAVDEFREAAREIVRKQMAPLVDWVRAQPRWVGLLAGVALAAFDLVMLALGPPQ